MPEGTLEEVPLLCTCGQDVCASIRAMSDQQSQGQGNTAETTGYTHKVDALNGCCCTARCTCNRHTAVAEPLGDSSSLGGHGICYVEEEEALPYSRHCSCCVPERHALHELDFLAAQYRNRMQRAQRQDVMNNLVNRGVSHGSTAYVDNTSSLLRSSRGNVYQQAVQREQSQRRQALHRELEGKRRLMMRQGADGGRRCGPGVPLSAGEPPLIVGGAHFRHVHSTSECGAAGCRRFYSRGAGRCHHSSLHRPHQRSHSQRGTCGGGCRCRFCVAHSGRSGSAGVGRRPSGNVYRCCSCDGSTSRVEFFCGHCADSGSSSVTRSPCRVEVHCHCSRLGESRGDQHRRPATHEGRGQRSVSPGTGSRTMKEKITEEEEGHGGGRKPRHHRHHDHPRRNSRSPSPDKRRSASSSEREGHVALSGPKYGHKVFVSDQGYLHQRAQYIHQWEKDGKLVELAPASSCASAPIGQRTPRWKTVGKN